MLGTLCILITALSCVSGVIVVTQKPPVLTVSKGGTATMDCNLGTVTDQSSRWYKQVPGGVPQFVLRYRHDWSAPKDYGAGFSSTRFTATHQSKSDYKFVISNVEVGDSAVYYCQTWDSTAKEVVFGQGTKLIVTDSSLPAPSLTLLPPSSEELKTDKATLVCLAQMSVGLADVSWTSDGNPVTDGVFTSSPEQKTDKSFGVSSFLTVSPSEWGSDRVFSCKVSHGSQASEARIKKSDCVAEELKTDKATLVCLAQMSVGLADVSWTSDGNPVTDGVFTSSPEQKTDKSFDRLHGLFDDGI
ncbi:immunoglobulin lambda-1 light chain-like [Megalops cyprinoides]|uniref:immunoglobulin lambda-1 light chain-like n=1 Tax=Megalops cyprinoides TaxID=118141 RepID=UPI0018656AAA|nr:immunoglobulin lambda-1 light chain-like [Megalops cyprinoides]